MVSDTRSPYTLSIGLLAILELELISQTEEILHGVTAETPVDQVLGMKYHYSWQTVHGGSGKIVVIPHPDYVGVAEFIVKQWIGVCTIPIVSSPRLCRGITDAHHRKHGGNNSFIAVFHFLIL